MFNKKTDSGTTKNYGGIFKERRPYNDTLPLCDKYNYHHIGKRSQTTCYKCRKHDHFFRDCREPAQPTCFECGSQDHLRNTCPRITGKQIIVTGQPNGKEPDVVTDMFLVNDHYASVLFDTGASKIFISTTFRPLIKSKSSKLGNIYTIELANGKIIEANV
ncbi:hypothetical protein L1987_57737 [Smallanthus sonchifolius]|uniref:Uncharacterized protein n=1 Tax=Smallanthus sonchifolius TaxID=185202 RepID=A0ACB9DDE0_9ASTR|nr:hypothetical protein L1987_57737 [Smallanthus sonchifolius]